MTLANVIQSTSAVLDLASGELLESTNFYPNGSRENWWAGEEDGVARHGVPLESAGFSGKEADTEVGLVYFGERYLVARLGRWSTPDPLSIHAAGGGEAGNSYHYVGGNLLQARDPWGLCPGCSFTSGGENPVVPQAPNRAQHQTGGAAANLLMGFVPPSLRQYARRGVSEFSGSQYGLDILRHVEKRLLNQQQSAQEHLTFWVSVGAEVGAGLVGALGELGSMGAKMLGTSARVTKAAVSASRSGVVRSFVLDGADQGVEVGVKSFLERVHRHVGDIFDEIAAEGDDFLRVYLRGEEKKQGLTPANFGHALEEELAGRLTTDPNLAGKVKWTGRSSSSYDFSMEIEGRALNLELTTIREADNHAERPQVNILTVYDRSATQ